MALGSPQSRRVNRRSPLSIYRQHQRRQHFPETADDAARHPQSYCAFLAELLMAECDDRARRRSERRIRAAAFPREK